MSSSLVYRFGKMSRSSISTLILTRSIRAVRSTVCGLYQQLRSIQHSSELDNNYIEINMVDVKFHKGELKWKVIQRT